MSRRHSDLFCRQMQNNNRQQIRSSTCQQTTSSSPRSPLRGRGGCGGAHTEATSAPLKDGAVIDAAMRLQREKQADRGAPMWAVLNLLLAASICAKLSGNLTSQLYDITRLYRPVWYAELTLAAVFSLNALFHIWTCLRSTVMGPSTLTVTPRLHALLGLSRSGILAAPPPQRPAAVASPFQNVQSFSPWRPSTTTSGPKLSPGCVLGSTPSSSSSSSLGFPAEGSGVRVRYHHTTSPSVFSAPRGNKEDYMEDLETLERFLHTEKEKDQQHRRSRQGGPLESPSHGPPPHAFWNDNRSVGDYNQSLRRFQYQPACRYSPPPSARKDDAADPAGSKRQTAEEVWARMAGRPVSADRLSDWTANLRMWISDTILAPLAEEIHSVNGQLRRTGSPDVQIGETAVGVLRQAAAANASSVPTMSAVVQYLDLGPDQDYLLDRIEELARGGCMSAFRWNGGGDARTGRRTWRADLPTDSAIVMHAFCTYLDSRLPAHPHHPDGKTFTSRYFARAPPGKALLPHGGESSGGAPKPICIHQGGANPPRYQLVHQGHVFSLPEDRNNLFHTLLLFLYGVRTHMAGMLGRVSLGPSGVNVLWIFTD